MREETSDAPQGVVLITGGSRGLGFGLACLLAAQGIPLVLTARNPRSLEMARTRLAASNARVVTVVADAASEPSMQEAFQAATSLGPLVGVVNNAGVLTPIGPIPTLNLSEFDAAMRTNVTGVLVGIRLALRYRTKDLPLRIVNVSSGAAVHPYAGWAAYGSSKAAATMLSRIAAIEAADSPSTSIVAVAPGVIETDMQRMVRQLSKEQFPDVGRFIALKRSGALLAPVQAAMLLDWLVRKAPFHLSGGFVDQGDSSIETMFAPYRDAPAMRQAVAAAFVLYGNPTSEGSPSRDGL